MNNDTSAPGQAQEQKARKTFGLSDREMEIANQFGHDVPGFISGELLLRGYGLQAFRVSVVLTAMIQRIAELEAPTVANSATVAAPEVRP